MSFGWSAGDIATAVKLFYTVGKALKESGEAASEYEDISSFLTSLQRTLRLLQSPDTIPFDREIKEEITEQCRRIQHHVNLFRITALKYAPALASERRKPFLVTAPRKVRWVLFMRDEIKKLQVQIEAPMVTVNTLMQVQAL